MLLTADILRWWTISERKHGEALCAHRRGGFHRDRSAQARVAALWLRLRFVPRCSAGPLVQTRFSLHVFQLRRLAFGRNQPGVFAAGRGGGGVVGHTETVAAGEAAANSRATCERAARQRWHCYKRLGRMSDLSTAFAPELDIVIFAPRAESVSEASATFAADL